MKVTGRTFIWDIQFTVAEVRVLRHYALNHYDAVCQSLAAEGGLIYRLNQSRWSREQQLQFRDIDLLCKVLEQANYDRNRERIDVAASLIMALMSTMKRHDVDYEVLNAKPQRRK